MLELGQIQRVERYRPDVVLGQRQCPQRGNSRNHSVNQCAESIFVQISERYCFNKIIQIESYFLLQNFQALQRLKHLLVYRFNLVVL